MRVLLKKIISDRAEMSESINNTETKYASAEDPLIMHRTALHETTLISEIANIINKENVIITPGQKKKAVSILSNEFCED